MWAAQQHFELRLQAAARDMYDRQARPTEEQIQAYLARGGGSELHQAVLLGDVERTRRLLAAGHDPNDSSGRYSATPLYYACGYCGVGLDDGDYAGCVAELIRAGAEVNVVFDGVFERNGLNIGFTPLHYIHARRLDAPAIAKLLVDAGANVNAHNVWGHTVVADLPSEIYPVRRLRASRRTTPIFLRAGAEIAPFLGWANFDNVYSPLETSNAVITGRTRRQSTRMAGLFHDPYLQKVHDTPGGFKAYEKQHLQAVTATFEPKFPQLPKEVVRYLMTFCFHLGFYVFALAAEVDSESPSDSDSTYE